MRTISSSAGYRDTRQEMKNSSERSGTGAEIRRRIRTSCSESRSNSKGAKHASPGYNGKRGK